MGDIRYMIKIEEGKVIIIDKKDCPSEDLQWDKKMPFTAAVKIFKFLEPTIKLEDIQKSNLILYRDLHNNYIRIIKNNYDIGDDENIKKKYLYYGCKSIVDRWEILDI